MTATPPDTNPTDRVSNGPWNRQDTILVTGLFVVAAVLRLWRLGAFGIDHFDSGGYAMSALALVRGDAGELYPLQHLLAPPFWFALVGSAMRIFGPGDGVMLVMASTVGSALVAVVFTLGRHWHSRLAGTSAALLLALSDYHISLSRTGLTDALFALCLVGALGLYWQADRRQSWKWAVLAGVATAMAWNTKYHGWLAGVIAGFALTPYVLQRDWPRLRTAFGRILVAAAVATLLYVPWVLWIESREGGYAYLASYQSGFLNAGQAVQHVMTHVYAQRYFTGVLSALAVPLALAFVYAVHRRLDLTAILWIVAAGFASWTFTLPVVLGAAALVGAVSLLKERDGSRGVLLAFVVVFSLLSPMYRPYARLLLPWIVAVTLLAGIGLTAFAQRPRTALRGRLVAGTALMISLGLTVLVDSGPRGSTYAASDGLERAASSMAARLVPNRPVVVIGEPAVVFYLRTAGVEANHVDQATDMYRYHAEGDTVHVVTGRYSTNALQDWAGDHPDALSAIESFAATHISDHRLLDDLDPWAAADYHVSPTDAYALSLFDMRVPAQPSDRPSPQ